MVTVATSSVIGSVHCVGMCGGFSLWAHQLHGSIAYHFGRLTGYLALGAAAGAIGRTALAIVPPRYQLVIGIGLGIFIIITGVRTLMGNHTQPPKSVVTRISKILPGALSRLKNAPPLQGFAIGFGSILLPCGWLYSFLAAAAATGSVVESSAVMFAFWCGTLPALIVGTRVWATATQSIKLRSLQLNALLLIAIGLITIGTKIHFISFTPAQIHRCHEATPAL